MEVEEEPKLDSAERRLNELGYKQELSRSMSKAKVVSLAFTTVTLFTGIIPLYGFSLSFEGPPPLVWGWLLVSLFALLVALALAEICSSFPTAGSLYFWTAHLAGPAWGPFASWCCAWLELLGTIAAIGAQAYAGSQVLQNIILLGTGTHKGGGYFAPPWVFSSMFVHQLQNGFPLAPSPPLLFILLSKEEGLLTVKLLQVIGGLLFVLYLPLVAPKNQKASFVFLDFQEFPKVASVPSKAYGVILSFLVSQYSLFGYDAAAQLTEETKDADINGPFAFLCSLGMVSVLGWAVILALTFSIQNPNYLYDTNNETAGNFVPAQILYDAFYGRYQSGVGAILMLINIWGSFFFGGVSAMTTAARVVYAFARDGGLPYSAKWRRLHEKRKVPANAVWLCTSISILIALPILKLNVVFTAMSSVCTIGWVGSHAVALLARARVPAKDFKSGRFHLGKAGRGVCWVALAWVCYTCAVFLLPTQYPLEWATFNYASFAVVSIMSFSLLWWALDARHWFKGPLPNITT